MALCSDSASERFTMIKFIRQTASLDGGNKVIMKDTLSTNIPTQHTVQAAAPTLPCHISLHVWVYLKLSLSSLWPLCSFVSVNSRTSTSLWQCHNPARLKQVIPGTGTPYSWSQSPHVSEYYKPSIFKATMYLLSDTLDSWLCWQLETFDNKNIKDFIQRAFTRKVFIWKKWKRNGTFSYWAAKSQLVILLWQVDHQLRPSPGLTARKDKWESPYRSHNQLLKWWRTTSWKPLH